MQTTKILQLTKTYHHGLKVLTIPAVVLLFLPNVFADSLISQAIPAIYLPQGHVIDALSGNGYNPSTLATLTTINSVNPAALVDLKRGFGLSYQYDTKINPAWFADFKHRRIFNAIPQSAGLTVTLRNLHLGLAMDQVYNSELDYGELIGTMVWGNDQGYIETYTFHPKKIESVYRYSFAAAYSLNRSKTLAIGFQYNQNHLNFSQYIGFEVIESESSDSLIRKRIIITQKTNTGNISVGIRYCTTNGVFSRILIGLYYESIVRFRHSFTYESEKLVLTGDIPDKLHAGVYLEMPIKLYFSGNLTYVFWKNTHSSFRNQPELTVNLGFPVRKKLTLSGGAFYTHYHRTDFSDNWNNKFKAVYLILGGIFRMNDLSVEFTCADSHLFSGEYRKQTLVKMGIGYSF
ncbi:MAG: hypothetical protein WC703_09960 [Candidatus Neomarinimicrobiota bacterium]